MVPTATDYIIASTTAVFLRHGVGIFALKAASSITFRYAAVAGAASAPSIVAL
jgi:hypothetical protein